MKLKQSFRNDGKFRVINQWLLPLSLVVLICAGCNQSTTKVASKDAADFSQMTIAELKPEADRGNPEAQFEMGERFRKGIDVPKNSSEAVEWWQKAAVRGYAPAQFDLGVAYGHGDGVPKDQQQALRWMNLAAKSELPDAEVALGIFYSIGGGGVTQNQTQAFELFKAAAIQGHPPAQYYLAICFRNGIGTARDSVEAVSWFQQAASNGLSNAQVALGKYYYETGITELFAGLGISTPDNRLPSQIKPDTPLTNEQRNNPNFFRSVEWLRKAAIQGDPEGQEYLAIACSKGFGTSEDPVEACKWLALASDKESKLVATIVEVLKTNSITFTPEQISMGKIRAEEFSKTNHVMPKSVAEYPGLSVFN